MRKRVVIAGAGGFGRGVYSWLEQSPRHCKKKKISEVVFIDDSTPKVSPHGSVVGTIEDYQPETNDEILVAVGVPKIRRCIVRRLETRNVRFHTFVDDRAIIARNTRIGIGSIVCPGTVISADATIGRHVHINFNCAIGHDAVLDDFTTLSPMSNVMGETKVGSEVFIGGSATLLPRIEIGDQTTVGAGACVTRSTRPGAKVTGVPAKEKIETNNRQEVTEFA